MKKAKRFVFKFEFLFISIVSILALLSCGSAKEEIVKEDDTTKKVFINHNVDTPSRNGNLLIHFDSVEDFMNYDPSKDTAREPSPTGEFRPLSEEEKKNLTKNQNKPNSPIFLYSNVEEEKNEK